MTLLEAHARSIFFSTLEREPNQWAEFLDETCADKPDLRARVDQLLKAHSEMGSIPGGPGEVSNPPLWASLLEGPGTVIGPYRLLEQIGEGGFGVVYMAEQTLPVRRKVALKIIKPGMDTRQVVARFEAERQALALMDHPNIAQVFDGGATATGRPYFVMELVRGIPITQFCDNNLLSVRQRIELFVTVCKAVQHAHQKGIIHRDLKPTNVMVTMHDDKQVVKVIDFGIAKAVGQQLTEKTLFTNFAQMIGTPPYMSPEQAQMSGLDADTRTDIYALGVLLYELLTGTTPFDQERLRTAAFDEIRRIIREEDPPKPSTRLSSTNPATTTASSKRGIDPRKLGQLLRGELDWIVMKCLEKDRNRRYETANGVASDLSRFLKNEPVHACPPSLAYRARVFARRHKASISTASLFLAIAVVGAAMTLWQTIRAASARDIAIKAQLDLSATRQNAAEERANTIARDLETLNQANGLIESGRSHADFSEWAKAETDLSQAVKLRPDHSSVWLTRGDVYARLRLWDLAAADFQRASGLRQHSSINALYLHAILRLYVGDKAGYHRACEQMVKMSNHPGDPRAWEKEEIARACLLEEESILTGDDLVQLTQKAADAAKTAIRFASLGTACYRAGLYETALEHLQEAKTTSPRWETSWTDSVSAMVHHRIGRPELARKALEAAGESLGRRFQQRVDTLGSSSTAPWWYEAVGELYFREAKTLIEGAAPREDPRKWIHRADSLAALGRNQDAIASFGQAIELSPSFFRAFERRAEVYLKVGDWQNALKDFERLRSLQPENADLNNEVAWRICTCPNLKFRDTKRAIELARKAVSLAPFSGSYWNTLGVALFRGGDWAGAVSATLNSMKYTHCVDVRDWLVLAMCEWRLDQKDKAKQLIHHAIRRIANIKSEVEYLDEFRNEATALIGQGEQSAMPPASGLPDDPSAYTLLLEIDPNAIWVYELRGIACGALKQWDQAAADFTRVTTAQPPRVVCWYYQAVSQIGARDMDAYRKVRADILKNFPGTKVPREASTVCYISVVAPASQDEAEAILRLAEFAVSATPGNPRIRGAANFRAGKYEATIADLTQSAKVFPRRGWDWLFLAMARHKLGHADEAKKSLQKAVEWIEGANRTRAAGISNPWMGWFEHVEVEQLLREARELLGEADPGVVSD